MSDPRRTGVVALLLILAGAVLLLSLPLDLVAVRLEGLALSWWYGVVLGPATAAAVAALALLRPMPRRVGSRPPA